MLLFALFAVASAPPPPPPLTPIDALALSITLVSCATATVILLIGGMLLCCCWWLYNKRTLWHKRALREWGHPGQLHRDADGALEWR